MNAGTLRRMVWGGLAIWTVTFWALAIIGAQSLTCAVPLPCIVIQPLAPGSCSRTLPPAYTVNSQAENNCWPSIKP